MMLCDDPARAKTRLPAHLSAQCPRKDSYRIVV
jgi:hypothetical protein